MEQNSTQINNTKKTQGNDAENKTNMQNIIPQPIIHLDSVCKYYQIGDIEVKALKHVNLSLPAQKLVVILGPSGSGKTTLLNLIGALDGVTQGQITVLSQDLTHLSRKKRAEFRRNHLGFIFQFFNLIPSLTALENVEYALAIRGDKDSHLHAENAISAVGLKDRQNHFPNELSGGEQQRVAIARALAKQPELILADEPTGELDYETGIKILDLLRTVVDSGKTVLMVTHNTEIARIADLTIKLRSGDIIEIIPNENPIKPEDLRW